MPLVLLTNLLRETARSGCNSSSDIPLNLQVKLLRLLKTRIFRRIGSTDTVKADLRLVCATHRDLREIVAGGEAQDPAASLSEATAISPLEEIARRYLHPVLVGYTEEKQHLAELLGVSERTLYRTLQGLREESR